ncbi:hypothetical protein PR048_024500 [Dryococelus australis]|uniref:Uncharacterized protein n=1 Tax=Dryococelus australis TaxID=614101 RepID=A0ABQ9GNT1_9NEOP|nr:hypothetical protein PR048_024500 [Dryococelus australis]
MFPVVWLGEQRSRVLPISDVILLLLCSCAGFTMPRRVRPDGPTRLLSPTISAIKIKFSVHDSFRPTSVAWLSENPRMASNLLWSAKKPQIIAPVSLVASHQGEQGSIPGRVTPGFPRAGIVPDDAAVKVTEASTDQRRNERAEEAGDPRENPPNQWLPHPKIWDRLHVYEMAVLYFVSCAQNTAQPIRIVHDKNWGFEVLGKTCIKQVSSDVAAVKMRTKFMERRQQPTQSMQCFGAHLPPRRSWSDPRRVHSRILAFGNSAGGRRLPANSLGGTSVFPRPCIPEPLHPKVSLHVTSGDDRHLRVPAGKPVTRRVLPRPGFTPHSNFFFLSDRCIICGAQIGCRRDGSCVGPVHVRTRGMLIYPTAGGVIRIGQVREKLREEVSLRGQSTRTRDQTSWPYQRGCKAVVLDLNPLGHALTSEFTLVRAVLVFGTCLATSGQRAAYSSLLMNIIHVPRVHIVATGNVRVKTRAACFFAKIFTQMLDFNIIYAHLQPSFDYSPLVFAGSESVTCFNDRKFASSMTCWLDSTVVCILEPQVFVHWLLPQRIANVTSHLAVWHSLLVSLQGSYWLRIVQGVSNEL